MRINVWETFKRMFDLGWKATTFIKDGHHWMVADTFNKKEVLVIVYTEVDFDVSIRQGRWPDFKATMWEVRNGELRCRHEINGGVPSTPQDLPDWVVLK